MINRRCLLTAAASLPLAGRHVTSAQDQAVDDLKQQIATEGSLAIFDARTTLPDQLADQFRQFIATTYDVEIAVTIDQATAASDLLSQIQISASERLPAPVDVMATTADHWMRLRIAEQESAGKWVEEFLPSDLIPNYDRIFTALRFEPTTVACQSANAPAMIYDAARIDWLTDWTDLADPRLNGRILLWSPGDHISDGMLLGLSSALKFDYRNPDQMDATLTYLTERIQPNAIRYTSDAAEVEALLIDGAIDVAIQWSSFARRLSQTTLSTARALLPKRKLFPFNDYLWIPHGAAHPVLARLFIDWRLSNAGVFPDRDGWGISDEQWLVYHQGIIGKSFEDRIPDWIAPTYFDLYPTADQFYKQIEQLDWEYYLANVDSWRATWQAGIG